MPEFEVTDPTGKRYQVTAPEGATQEQVLAYAQSQFGQKADPPSTGEVGLSAIGRGAVNLLNAPVAMADAVIHGLTPPFLRDKVPHIPNYPMQAAEALGVVDEKKAPQTMGQRVLDSAVQTGTQAGLVAGPVGVLGGALAGGAAQLTKELTGSTGAAALVGLLTPAAIYAAKARLGKGATTATLEQTLKDGQQVGLVVPPSAVKPGAVTNQLESFGGKAAMGQQASLKNQTTADRLAVEEIGLPVGTPLDEATYTAARKQAAEPYRQMQAVSPQAAKALEGWKEKNLIARENWKLYKQTPDPKFRNKATAAEHKADHFQAIMEKEATKAGKPDLMKEIKAAKVEIAKLTDLERATNLANGHVDGRYLAGLLDEGRPLTGNLKVIARFAQAFPAAMREASVVPTPGVSALNPITMGGLAGYGAAQLGPAGLALAGVPLLRGPVRSLLLSDLYQRRLLPNPPSLTTALEQGALAGMGQQNRNLSDYLQE